jgi:hypothetical protein
MVTRLVLSSAMLFAPMAHAQQAAAPETPCDPPLLLEDLDNAEKAGPQKAPPGKLCLIDAAALWG